MIKKSFVIGELCSAPELGGIFGQLVCDITCLYFRLTSRSQDVGLRPDEGDVGPINGHPEKR